MNGIYHVDFSSPLGSGSGTIYLENGILRGGDAAVAYCGTYLLDRDTLNAQAKIIKHGAGFSILGDATSLAFQGEISSGSISGIASIPGSNLQAKILGWRYYWHYRNEGFFPARPRGSTI